MNLFKVAFYLPFLRGHIFALPFYSHSSATIGEFSAAIFSEFDSTSTLIVYIWPSSCSTKPQYGYPYLSLSILSASSISSSKTFYLIHFYPFRFFPLSFYLVAVRLILDLLRFPIPLQLFDFSFSRGDPAIELISLV